MASCSTLKKTFNKTKTEDKTDITIKTISKKVTEENLDSNLIMKESVLVATGDETELKDGGIIHETNEDLDIKITQDPKTKKITATAIKKEKIIPISIHKRITEDVDQNIHGIEFKKTAQKTQTKSRTPGINTYLWWIILIILLLLIIYFFRKKIKAYISGKLGPFS